jgi:hypothetical protein
MGADSLRNARASGAMDQMRDAHDSRWLRQRFTPARNHEFVVQGCGEIGVVFSIGAGARLKSRLQIPILYP